MHQFPLTIDRFEGDAKDVAVLLTEEGRSIDFPRSLLPKGVRAGDVLKFMLEKDAEATKSIAAATARIQKESAEQDDGGDIKL